MRTSNVLEIMFSLALLLLKRPVLGKDDSQSGVGIKASDNNHLSAGEFEAAGLITQQSGRELAEQKYNTKKMWTSCFLMAMPSGAGKKPPKTRIGCYEEGEWEDCIDTTGICIDTSVYTCSTGTLTGYCPGGANIRCCEYPAGVKAGSCYSEDIGLCGFTEDCWTTTIAEKCPGPAGVTCCPECLGGTKCGYSYCCTADQVCESISTTWHCVDA